MDPKPAGGDLPVLAECRADELSSASGGDRFDGNAAAGQGLSHSGWGSQPRRAVRADDAGAQLQRALGVQEGDRVTCEESSGVRRRAERVVQGEQEE